MTKISETVVFFGSGPVAAASLRLLAADVAIEAIVTKPRPAHHHGSVPVLEAADDLHLHVHAVENRADLDKLFRNNPFHSRVGVLIDFGIIVSQEVIDYFPLGIVNSHFSLLPEWRGADPITFAILSGQHQTGVSLMLLVAAMDEGPLLAQRPYAIAEGTTTPQLTDALTRVSHQLLRTTLPAYLAGALQPYPQDTSRPPSYSRRLSKADGLIDWRKPATQLEREIRAFAGWPKSYSTIAGKEVVIIKAAVADRTLDRKSVV